MIACTIVSANYLAYARVLEASWTRAHPSSRFVVLVLDGCELASDLDVVTPEQLGLDPTELLIQRGMYDRLELATALKPHLLAKLLREGAESAVYVDPDMEVFRPLADIGAAAADHTIALCPHVLGPIPKDGCSPTEQDIQMAGIFNGGLIAVGSSAQHFLAWWARRLARDCVQEPWANLYVDQRPLDWVPCFFHHLVLRDPTLNVAWWNLHERRLSEGIDGYEVNGSPLRLFHFSGFAPERPDLLTTFEGSAPLRTGINRQPALRKLCAEYAARVVGTGHSSISDRAYDFGFRVGGAPLTMRDRRIYRAAVVHSERAGDELPPSPFDPARADDFARLVALATDEWLPLKVRARLGQLRTRADRQTQVWHRGRPPSSAQRALAETRWILSSLGKTRRRQRSQADAVLLDLLVDVERRLGTPVTLTEEAIISRAPSR